MEKEILVETSARHIHLNQASLDFLMGEEGSSLVSKKELSQPGQYLSTSKFDLVGPINEKTGKERKIAGVSVLGPLRKKNQVEISMTDSRALGVKAPIRESGDIIGSAPISIVNPLNGRRLDIKEGLIVAKRHIHMTSEDAAELGVENGEIVKVLIPSEGRKTIFDDVVIRVREDFALAMHIDTDEANAANASGLVYGTIRKCCHHE